MHTKLQGALDLAEVLAAIKFPKGTVLRGEKGGVIVSIPGKRPFAIIMTERAA